MHDERLLAMARNVRAGLLRATDYDDEVATIYNALRLARELPADQPAPTETGPVALLRAWIEAERFGADRRIDSGSSARGHWVGYRHALDMVLSRIEYPSHPNDALAEPAPQGAPSHDYATCEGCNPNPLKR